MNKHLYMPLLLAFLIFLLAADSSATDEVKIEGVRNCISARSLRNTAVIDDQNILFFMVGKRVFHNILPKRCNGMAKFGSFTYSSLGGRLCNFDSIDVLGADGLYVIRTCRLGRFHPTTKSGIPAIIERLSVPPNPEAMPPAEVEEMDEVESSDELEEIVIRSDEPEESMPNRIVADPEQ